ncbi:hypothetical protein [Leptospira kmetyi]|uniref:Uncharacterized protein n=1 Tax=Leptospira kmetyi TaxID=408139 RepID=A0ABX4NBE0_9LEPT|nr:hypothetical protein [Leptospira kmetyi]PJZ28730.1 hypothetical protein CH378_16145 [Leptospira kmetyi]PJZ39498.1 hypothetical protein CH370_20790 [Leptospira kmetyi]
MNQTLRDSIQWHFREGYTLMKTWEILSWSNRGLRLEEVKGVFEELESRIPKAGIRKEKIAA